MNKLLTTIEVTLIIMFIASFFFIMTLLATYSLSNHKDANLAIATPAFIASNTPSAETQKLFYVGCLKHILNDKKFLLNRDVTICHNYSLNGAVLLEQNEAVVKILNNQ